MSTSSFLLIDDSSEYLVKHLPIEFCTYRGEGNANLVVALFSLQERKVIRLRKSLGGSTSLQEDARRVRREVDFIRSVISGFLASYVCVPEILRFDQTEIARLSEKIHQLRPENRRSKAIISGYATLYPDYTFLPPYLSTFSSKTTFCVEIKPKQGFICELDRQYKKCPYCLMQYYKKHTGVMEEKSNYCPFDLFSGKVERMDRALQALLRSPQNNLRIFKDGVLIYKDDQRDELLLRKILTEWFDCSDYELNLSRFLSLVRTSLTRAFVTRFGEDEFVERPLELQLEERSRREAAVLEVVREIAVPSRIQADLGIRASKLLSLLDKECEFTDGHLPSGSVLERILRMQKLHLCGADAVTWIHANCSTLFADDLLYADLLDSSPPSVKLTESRSPQDTQRDGHKIQHNCLQHLSVKDCISIIENYLLFCTAKDCSILMAFQEIDKKTHTKLNPEHIIELSTRDQQSFVVNVRVLDLDMKSLKSIEKHQERDNNVLQATIKELEKQIDI